jgi:glycosyltransferase involved in cell wall biosynthesis
LKHILIINPWVGKVGPNTFIEGFVKKNIDIGNKITILYPYEDSLSNTLKFLGCNIYFIRILKFNHISNKFFKIFFRLFIESLLFVKFSIFIRNKKFTHCFINTEVLSFSIIPFSLFVRTSMIVHSLSFNASNFLSVILFKIQNLLISDYFAVSNAVKQSLLNKMITKPIHMIYNGLDLIMYNVLKEVPEEKTNVINILSVIHPLPHKGAHYLLDVINLVIKQNKNVKFTIVGWDDILIDIKYKSEIEKRVLKDGFENYITFKKSTNKIIDEYIITDILLHTSKSESFGYVLIEAMALKIPVVAFKVGGIPEVIENNISGYLIDPYNIIEMSDSLLRLIEDYNLRKQFGNNGYKIVKEKFQLNKNINQIINILKLN